jgi:transposase
MPNRQQQIMDRLWSKVRPLLPRRPVSPAGGRPPADDRACFEGIVWVLRSGARWRDLPNRFPSPATCWRRHAEWSASDVWDDVWVLVLGELDGRGRLKAGELSLDAAFVPAKKGATRSAGPTGARG